jgi:thiamine-monophosphate kinase
VTPTGGLITEDSGTVAALGEFGLIAALSGWLPADRRTLVGIGDDAAVLAVSDGRVVASTDFLLEGRHFRRDWSSAHDIGAKAAARSLIDVAAMGAVPTGLLVALAAPADLPVSWARDLTEGLAAECARAGASVIGGDTARASSVLLATTGLGDLAGRAPVLRSGAAPGDLVAVTGPLGHAAAGLALLSAGRTDDPLTAAHRRPAPPYDAGPEAADLGATAMIDISDGLLADLGHIAESSGVLIDLSSARLAPDDSLLAAARTLNLDLTDRGSTPGPPSALAWVLTGGDDHALAATFGPGTALPSRWTVMGEVRTGQGVLVDGQPWTGSAGWDHFAVLATGDEPVKPPWRPRGLAGDPACLDAGGAHVQALGRAAHHGAYTLDVRVPAAAGAAV